MNSKQKGNRGERELLHLLQSHRDVAVRRNQQGGIGGAGNPDLDVCVGGTPWHMEVKRTERFSPYTAYAQAARDAVNAVPVVAHRRNNGCWMVFMRLEDWLDCQSARYRVVEHDSKRACDDSTADTFTGSL